MKRILFVDDNQHLLNGLKRGLRTLRRQWDMHFVTSAAEALEYMRSTDVDVVITDYRMPEMSGFELLSKIQDEFPTTVRVILTGQPDRETYIESMRVCHYFLWKPLDIERLIPLLERISALDNLMINQDLIGTLHSITALPTLPDVYTKLTRMLDNSEEDVHEIISLIRNDVSLTMQILKMVNSSFFGLIRELKTLDEAIQYLGLNTIRSMVLAHYIFNLGSSAANEEDLYQLWQHSCTTALLAEGLVTDRSDTYLRAYTSFAGLLHDIGKLIFIYYLPEVHADAKKLVQEHGIPRFEAEHQLLGYTHAEIGAYLAQLWGLPYALVEAIYLHLTADIKVVYGLSDMAAAVWHANRISHGDISSSQEEYHILQSQPGLRKILDTLIVEDQNG